MSLRVARGTVLLALLCFSGCAVMRTLNRRKVFCLVLLLGQAVVAIGQPSDSRALFCQEERRQRQTVDARGLAAVYCTQSGFLARPLEGAHATARPVFYGAVPAAWGAALISPNVHVSDAYRLTLAQGGTYGLVWGVKRIVGRPRPYVPHALTARSDHHDPPEGGDAYRSFPSGHAAVSAALATSWSLSYPRWYVLAPGAAWAVGVSLSRLYLGVHYPSDVLTGMVLGIGGAVFVHHLRRQLTPASIEADRERRQMPAPITIRIRF